MVQGGHNSSPLGVWRKGCNRRAGARRGDRPPVRPPLRRRPLDAGPPRPARLPPRARPVNTEGMNQGDDYAEPGSAPGGPFPLWVVVVLAMFVGLATLAVFGCLRWG